MASDPSLDMDAGTGAKISGWPHVLLSIEDFMTTRFGERIMREYYGSMIPAFLGENLNTQTVVPFFTAIAAAVEQWEPRYRIIKITPESVGRNGRLKVTIEGQYRPRALLGDFTPEGARRLTVLGGAAGEIEVSE